jgi:hypothetical protein
MGGCTPRPSPPICGPWKWSSLLPGFSTHPRCGSAGSPIPLSARFAAPRQGSWHSAQALQPLNPEGKIRQKVYIRITMYYDIHHTLKNSVLRPANFARLISLLGGARIVRIIFYPAAIWKDCLIFCDARENSGGKEAKSGQPVAAEDISRRTDGGGRNGTKSQNLDSGFRRNDGW